MHDVHDEISQCFFHMHFRFNIANGSLVFYLRLVLVCGVSLSIKALKVCLFCSQRFAHVVRWQRDCTIGTWQSATPRTLSALPSPLCGASRVGGARELVVSHRFAQTRCTTLARPSLAKRLRYGHLAVRQPVKRTRREDEAHQKSRSAPKAKIRPAAVTEAASGYEEGQEGHQP